MRLSRFKNIKAAPVFLALLFLFTACQAQPEVVVTEEVEVLPLPAATVTPVVVAIETEEDLQPAEETAIFLLEMEDDTARVGEEFVVSVLVDTGGQKVDMVQVNLNFDPGILEVIEIQPGDVLTVMLQSEFDNGTGMIDYAAGLLGETVGGKIEVMKIKLKAVKQMTVGIPLSFNFGLPRETSIYSQGQSVLKKDGARDFLIKLAPAAE